MSSDLVFNISQNIVLGSFTINKLPLYLREHGNAFMLIMEQPLKGTDIGKQLLKTLDEHEIKYFIYDNTEEGAESKNVECALKLARQAKINGVVAIGITQTLLLGAVVASTYNDERSIYDIIDSGDVMKSEPLPLICVPSTIRVPYVFTSSIPFIDSRSKRAKLLKVQKNLCKLVMWDSELTTTLSDNTKLSTCIEALNLAFEAYVSQKANFFSDMFAKKAVERLSYAMNGAESLDVTTPKPLLLTQGGFLSSIAVATSAAGVASLLSIVINARYGVSLSQTCSILFPYMIEDAIKFKAQRIEELVAVLSKGQGAAGIQNTADFLKDVKQRLSEEGLPQKLGELGLTIDKLALIAEDAAALDMSNTLPRSMTTDELFEMLKAAL